MGMRRGRGQVLVCQVSDVPFGQMRQFEVDGQKMLLTHTEDGISAIAPHCSHYGAPLKKGVLHAGRIVCPWHNACFNAVTGAQLSPPGRDDVTQFPSTVEIQAGNVYVTLLEDPAEHILPYLTRPNPDKDSRTFVIVGAGAAGEAAAQMLRQVEFAGKIIVLSAEDKLPYDRTKLSKAYLQSDSVDTVPALRPASFYREYGIKIKTSARVTDLDIEAQQLTYGYGETLSYDALLIASGGTVKTLPIEGAELENVFTLRNAADAKQILATALKAKKAVVIGSGFIGMEAAASLRQQGLEVTVVSPSKVPFEKVLGEAVGKLFQQVHESNGVKFILQDKAAKLQGDGKVSSVVLESGENLPADIVVVGIGVKPATEFANGLLKDDKTGSIVVNQYLQATANVYAAGDVTQFPHFITGEPTHIEHWRLAMQQGRIAACNMMGQQVAFKAVPFFWTGQFDLKLRYVGHSEAYEEVIIQGSLEEKSFLAFYIQEHQAMAVSGIGRDRDIAAISELMRLRKMPTPEKIKSSDMDWAEQLASV
ncbi:MAG: FAD-dependent oxidoreductase [Cyanobacteria bacterium J06623_4]